MFFHGLVFTPGFVLLTSYVRSFPLTPTSCLIHFFWIFVLYTLFKTSEMDYFLPYQRSPGEGYHSHEQLQPSTVRWWALREFRKERNTCHLAVLRLRPLPTGLFYTSVSFLLSHIQSCHYHLSKFHIYALVYCIGVFVSGLLHSV